MNYVCMNKARFQTQVRSVLNVTTTKSLNYQKKCGGTDNEVVKIKATGFPCAPPPVIDSFLAPMGNCLERRIDHGFITGMSKVQRKAALEALGRGGRR
jgi:hypothetical protein